MPKIKVCLHLCNTGPGCIIHHFKNTIKYIDRDKFDIYLATINLGINPYLHEFRKFLRPENILLYNFNGHVNTYQATETDVLYQFLVQNKIDVLHTESAGELEWPANINISGLKIITSNVFAGVNNTKPEDKVICISDGCYNTWIENCKKRAPNLNTNRGTWIYMSIDDPAANENMRDELGISDDTIVIGRASNSWGADSLNLEAYSKIENDKTLFLSSTTPHHHEELIKKYGIKRYLYIDPRTSYYDMSRYYNTLDILAHDRAESFGCAVAEAMMHAVPVVTSNYSKQIDVNNAHQALIEDEKFCARGGPHDERLKDYIVKIKQLMNMSKEDRRSIGLTMKDRITRKCYAPNIIKQYEKVYTEAVENG